MKFKEAQKLFWGIRLLNSNPKNFETGLVHVILISSRTFTKCLQEKGINSAETWSKWLFSKKI